MFFVDKRLIMVMISLVILGSVLLSYNYSHSMSSKINVEDDKAMFQNHNMVYYLEYKPGLKDIIPENINDTYTVIAYVDVNTTITLDSLAQQLENNGFIVTSIDYDKGFLEYHKTYYNFPSRCNSGTVCPSETVYGRVYNNGTILSYVNVGSINLGSLGLLDPASSTIIPVTGKAVIEILNILGRQELVYSIKYSIPSHPDARYLIFIYPSTDWFAGRPNAPIVDGYYTVSPNITVLAAGYINIIKDLVPSTVYSELYIDDNLISEIRIGGYAVYADYGSIPVEQYFAPGSTHNVKLFLDYDAYGFFIITVIAS